MEMYWFDVYRSKLFGNVRRIHFQLLNVISIFFPPLILERIPQTINFFIYKQINRLFFFFFFGFISSSTDLFELFRFFHLIFYIEVS